MTMTKAERNIDNCLEWTEDNKDVYVTLSAGFKGMQSKVRKLANSNPDLATIIVDSESNDDGSMYAKISLKCLKISAPRKVSEETRAANAERLKKARLAHADRTENS